MTHIQENLSIDQTPIVRLENDLLRVDVAPGVGGKIVQIEDRTTGFPFLWHNRSLKLEKSPPGSEYDPNFYGGADELLPNDIPEPLNGVDSPDHGELWTLALDYQIDGETLVMTGALPLCGLFYEKRVSLRPTSPHLDLAYRLHNPTPARRIFLWKLHVAVNIEPGDRIDCPAAMARPVDPAWSRWSSLQPFPWPEIEGQRADLIPLRDGSVDFLYLYDLNAGYMAWHNQTRNLSLALHFDHEVFPYAWYFASYGGFDGHYTAVLEPCTTMPLSVNEAAELGQCSDLAPDESIETKVTVYAGPESGYLVEG